MKRTDVVVIGAGIIGRRRRARWGRAGRATIMSEQLGPGHTRGSSRATRIFRLSYQEPDYVPMCVRALDLWRELEDAAGEQLLITTGDWTPDPGAPPSGDALAAPWHAPRIGSPTGRPKSAFPASRSTAWTESCTSPTAG